MERTISAEERIRKAEEIYYKRKMQNLDVKVNVNSANPSKSSKPNYKLFQKLIVQVIICIIIYLVFYLVQNSNYIFSKELITKVNGILSYDINFQKMYQKVNDYFVDKTESNNEVENQNMQEEDNNNLNNEENISIEENIGGAVENLDNNMVLENAEEKDLNTQNMQLSQMEIDANNIKNNYTFIKPLQGTITSRFGLRNPTTSSVPKNHTGIDIAANKGSIIYSALDGVVTIASSQGDYGKHLRIEKDDIAIYYAHCNKLYVSEGDIVKQGDAIAEVGSTGNATGPHLHFEIRKENRYVNPDLIIEF